MKSISIISQTETGKRAIEQHLIEVAKSRKSKFPVKAMGYKFLITSEDPKILEISLTKKIFQRLVRSPDFRNMIAREMKEYGAELDKDYRLEVEE